jgi:sugar lactone lactonase YvrE
MGRRGVGILAAVAVAAGLVVAVPGFRIGAHATAPTPGIVTNFAGGSTTGYATSIAQAPWGLAWLGSNLLISDVAGLRILALNPATGVETLVAGNGQAGPSGDGGPATAAAIGYPRHLALDGTGDIFFAADDRVREILANGTITTVAGGGAGCTEPCPATSASFSNAHGVAVDAAGDLFIADTYHHVIRKVTSGQITTIAGTYAAGFSGDAGPANLAQLNFPEAVAADSSGNLFISDSSNNRVREIDHTTGKINTIAGTGAVAGICPTGAALTTPVWDPQGLSFDSMGNLLIAADYDQCIKKLSAGNITNVASLNGVNWAPRMAVADASGNIYATETPTGPNGGHVHKFTTPTTDSVVAGITGSCQIYGINGPASSAMLCGPDGVTVAPNGEIFIADPGASQVVKVDAGGVLRLVAGTGTAGMLGDNGPATSAQLNQPVSVAVDSLGNVYISDLMNDAVRRVDHTSGTITTYAGTLGAYGFAGDGQLATAAKLFNPWQITFDPSGNLYIADPGNARIRKVDLAGKISTFAGDGSTSFDIFHGQPAITAHINGPTGVAADSLGNVFIASIQAAARVDAFGNIWSEANGAASFLAIGPGNRLVATSSCEAILIPSSLVPVVLAGSSNQAGCSGNSGDGGPATAAQFNTLYGVAVDGSGDVFVGDRINKRVRRIQAYRAPVAPTAVSAVAASNRAAVQWTAPSASGGLPILDYAVTPYTGSTAHPAVHVSTTSTPVTGLINGTTYTFTVAASNGWATGPASAPSAAVTPVLTAVGTILTFAGGPGSGVATGIGQVPYALAVDNNANDLYVGDLASPVVRDLNLNNNQESVLAGSDGYGFAGDGGPPLSALMEGAGAIAACGGYTYIADTLNYVIRIVDHNTGKIRTVAGTGTPGYSGDGGPGTQAQISRVLGLACRTGGGVYISDSDNGAVRILDQSGVIYTWWKGLSFPTGLVELPTPTPVDDVAVADAGADNAVLELTDKQPYLIAGTPGHAGYAGDGGPSYQALLNNPRAVALYGTWPYTLMYVADTGNNQVRLVDLYNLAINSFAGGFNQPTGLAVANITLYVADTGNLRVAAVAVSGVPVTTVAGNGTPSLGGDGGPAGSAEMGNPYAVALDASGNEYIADNQDNVIRKVDTSGTITTFVGLPTLNDPRGVAVDAAGNVYVSDSGSGRILEFDPAGNFKQTIASGLSHPRGLVVDALGNVFVADTGNNRVVKVTSPGVITAFAGTGTAGFSGDGAAATAAKLNGPRAVVIDALGNVFISDSQNNRVREVTLNGNINTVVGNGTAGQGGDGGLATAAQLNFPFGLGFDGAGNLYIADTANQRLRVVDSLGRISTVVGACSAPGFSGDGGLASTAQLNSPFGIAVDGAGDVYVADVNNNRVRGAYALTGVRNAACQGPAGSPSSRGTNPGPVAPPPPPPRMMDGGGFRTLPATIQPTRTIAATLPVRIKPAAPGAISAAPSSTGAQPATSAQSPAAKPPAARLPARLAAVAQPSPPPGLPYLQLLAAAGALSAIMMAALRLRRRRRRV